MAPTLRFAVPFPITAEAVVNGLLLRIYFVNLVRCSTEKFCPIIDWEISVWHLLKFAPQIKLGAQNQKSVYHKWLNYVKPFVFYTGVFIFIVLLYLKYRLFVAFRAYLTGLFFFLHMVLLHILLLLIMV